MLNQIVLMGRFTRDPELRRTKNGTAVASFTLAVERDFGQTEDGKRITDFIDIVAWKHTAEFVDKYFKKGQLAAVGGRLQIRDWTNDKGTKHRAAEVVADNVYFAEGKRDSTSQRSFAPPSSAPSYDTPAYPAYSSPVAGSGFAELEDDDGDLPF